MIIFHLVIFLFFILFFLIIPSKVLFSILRLREGGEIFINLGLTLSIGIVLLTLVGFIIRLLGFGFWPVWFMPLVSVIYLFSRNKKFIKEFYQFSYKNYSHSRLFILMVILAGVLAQNIVLFRGGWKVTEGLVFPSTHDTMWNIAIVNELYHHFPPQHPGVAGEPLKNHHFFYHFFLAILRGLTNLNVLDIYFRLGPVMVSLIFGLSIYAVSTIFSKNYLYRGITVFLGIFSGNFAYLVPIFKGINFDWRGNTFFSDQPFDQITNPYSVLGFSFFLFSIYTFNKIFGEKQNFNWGWLVVASLFIGSLYGFKSFGGIIAIISLYLACLIAVLFYKKIIFFLPAVTTTFIFLLVFFFVTDLGKTGLHWAPGWLLTEVNNGDKLNLPTLINIEIYYHSINNALGLIKIKLFEFFIYFIGNLGVRILGLFYLFWLLLSKVKFPNLRRVTSFYIFFGSLSSFFIPLLFNLGQNAHNIVQFTPYALLLLAILTSVALEEIDQRLKKIGKAKIGIATIIIVVILAIPVNVKNILSKLEMPKELIRTEEVDALEFIRSNSRNDDILLINPTQLSLDGIYVSAFSERRIYLASSGYARQTGKDPQEREKAIVKFFAKPDRSFLEENDISYVYILKPSSYEDYQYIGKKLGSVNLVKVYENDKVVVFKKKNSPI